MRQNHPELFISEVAAVAECHTNTVRRYEKKGLIKAKRDLNGYRRFPVEEANKLKKLLDRRH